MSPLEKVLRNSLARALQDGRSLADLARVSGVDHVRLGRFHRHERTLQLDGAGRLAEALGLELLPRDV